jgi:fructose-1,6-bisphosphatase/inositol monophosphatase family enzyme
MVASLLTGLGTALRETAALEIVPRFRNLSQTDVIAKPSSDDPTDLVTVADRAAEAQLTERLMELVPGSVVVGEEGAAVDPGMLARLRGSSPVWVVDPLDGTRNFAAGHGPFGCMAALVERGVLLASGIYLPLEDRLLTAELGRGAYVNGQRIRSGAAVPEQLRGTIYGRFLPPEARESLVRRAGRHDRIAGVICAAAEYANVAVSTKDYVVYFRLLPWDHAPGALIVREAGGVVRHPDGRDYEVFDQRELTLVAPSPTAWLRAQGELFAA